MNIFPTVARIPDGMLKKVDPSNPVLEAYLLTISTNYGTGVLLAKHDEGSSKNLENKRHLVVFLKKKSFNYPRRRIE